MPGVNKGTAAIVVRVWRQCSGARHSSMQHERDSARPDTGLSGRSSCELIARDFGYAG